MNLDDKGLATRRAVLGDAYVDAALAVNAAFTASVANPWLRSML